MYEGYLESFDNELITQARKNIHMQRYWASLEVLFLQLNVFVPSLNQFSEYCFELFFDSLFSVPAIALLRSSSEASLCSRSSFYNFSEYIEVAGSEIGRVGRIGMVSTSNSLITCWVTWALWAGALTWCKIQLIVAYWGRFCAIFFLDIHCVSYPSDSGFSVLSHYNLDGIDDDGMVWSVLKLCTEVWIEGYISRWPDRP